MKSIQEKFEAVQEDLNIVQAKIDDTQSMTEGKF